MEDFIGNNAKAIVEWGQVITIGVILLFGFIIYRLVRNNKYFLPKGILSALVVSLLTILILISGLAFIKVTQMKPRVSQVLSNLESLHNNPAPSFNFRLLENDTLLNISHYKGKVVLLNYWATWCPPCIKEMPGLNQLQEDYKDRGLVILALSDEEKSRLERFAEKHPFTVIAAYSKEFDWADIQSERPMTFLINREGVIVDYFTGGYNYEFFESKILDHIN